MLTICLIGTAYEGDHGRIGKGLPVDELVTLKEKAKGNGLTGS